MKKLALLGIILLTACTPMQLATFEQATGVDIAPNDEQSMLGLVDAPMKLDATHMIATDGTVFEVAPPPPPGPCGQWHGLAMDVGWTEAQWSTLKFIMRRESNCQPEVMNPSGASGLLQIMPMWADDCGGSRSALFDARFNLACGLHILHVSGWRAWAL